MNQDNPEFKKLAFTAPGPKDSFAPLKRSDYVEKRKMSVTSSEEDGEVGGGGARRMIQAYKYTNLNVKVVSQK